jgi:hypothetical protein
MLTRPVAFADDPLMMIMATPDPTAPMSPSGIVYADYSGWKSLNLLTRRPLHQWTSH